MIWFLKVFLYFVFVIIKINKMKIILYISYFLLILTLFFLKIENNIFLKIVFLSCSLILFYVNIIETNILIVKNISINTWFKSKNILISDLHFWYFKKPFFAERLVNKLNKIEAENIFIAWDLVYKPDVNKIWKLFKSFKKINKNIYFVLWNHDVENNIKNYLIKELKNLWFNYIDNKIINFWSYKLIWLWDRWSNNDDILLINNFWKNDNIIVLTHNPDTILKYENHIADLTLCWHTHWWQIRIPYFYKKVIPTKWNFDKWLSYLDKTILYISSWLWETWLPTRFLNFPTIDIINTF